MGQVADPNSYQEVMNELSAYTSKVFEQCSNMQSAASACISVMDDDPAAAKSAASLNKCLSQIQEGVNQINAVRAAMAKELEDIRAAAAKANFD